MNCQCRWCGVLAALAFATTVPAQIASPPSVPVIPQIVRQQSFTTGMVGFTSNQIARLNVLNLNSVPATTTTTTPNCTLELRFFDNKNNIVTQTVVPNFAPGMATSFDLPRSSVTSETATRAEIRGVVVVNPSPTPVGSPAAVGYCSVITTLEIFDATTGSTVSLTSDTRAVGLSAVVPLIREGVFRQAP